MVTENQPEDWNALVKAAFAKGPIGIQILRKHMGNMESRLVAMFDEMDLPDDVRANINEATEEELGFIQAMLAYVFERAEMLDELEH